MQRTTRRHRVGDTTTLLEPAVLTDDEFVLAVYDELRRRTRHGIEGHGAVDADDIVQRCIVRSITRLPLLRARYSSPIALAAALLRSGPADFRRSERIQQSLGASGRGGRVAVDLDRSDAPRLVDPGPDRLDRVLDAAELRPEILAMPPTVRALAWMVHVEGRTVDEAARRVGWSRSHASRQLARCRAQRRPRSV